MRRHIKINARADRHAIGDEEYRLAKQADRLGLVVQLPARLRHIDEHMGHGGQRGHRYCAAPGEQRVPAVLFAVGHAQEHVSRPECLPHKVAQRGEPEEGGRRAELANDVWQWPRLVNNLHN